MHKKPEIGFVMPDTVEAGKKFEIQINFDGAKLKSAEVWVIKVPAAGYKDAKTGKTVTAKNAKADIEEMEKENKKKMFKPKSEDEKKKEMKSAAGGDDNILKVFKLHSKEFEKGLNWWKKGFALKISKEDYNVLLKLEACGASGCFVRTKYLKATKLSDANRDKYAKEALAKFKTKGNLDAMDKDEITDSLAMMKEQNNNKQRTCKRGACEIKDATGKKVEKKEVDAKNKVRQEKAAKLKKEWEAKEKEAKAKGKVVAVLKCPSGKDDTGKKVECSGVGICTMGKSSGKGRCACDFGFEGAACQLSAAEKAEMKTARKNAIEKMKKDAAAGKLASHKQQKDFLKSMLADNDDEVDMDPEVAEDLMKSQKSYAEELMKKMQRKKKGKADATDADFTPPSKDEVKEMMEQTLKLKKQRAAAKQAKKDKEEFDKDDSKAPTVKRDTAKALTKAEREAKRAEKKAERAAKKEEMAMLKNLQAVQGTALLEEMTKGGKKTAVAEQSYGETYMKTTVLDAASVDEQMYTDGSGEKKMQISKGAAATVKGEDAVADAPASTTPAKPAATTDTTKPATGTTTKPATGTTTKPATGTTTKPADSTAAKTRLLNTAAKTDTKADATKTAATTKPATTTTAAPTTTATTTAAPVVKDDKWKKLKKEEDYMRVIVNKKMFEEGGPLFGVKKPVITFNKHGGEYVKDYPIGKSGDYDATTGKKVAKAAADKTAATKAAATTAGVDTTKVDATTAAAATKAIEEATAADDDYLYEDTSAHQVMELDFTNGETLEKIKVSGLKPGMLQICMMMKNETQSLQYLNEDNEMMQKDGIKLRSLIQKSTQDEVNEVERKGYEMCVDLTHATTFATLDEASSSLFSYSIMVVMTLLAVLFFNQE